MSWQKYHTLEKLLKDKAEYEAISMEVVLPAERTARFRYLEGLALPFSVQLSTRQYGGSKVMACFIWKVPLNQCDADPGRAASILATKIASLEVVHSRARIKKIQAAFESMDSVDRECVIKVVQVCAAVGTDFIIDARNNYRPIYMRQAIRADFDQQSDRFVTGVAEALQCGVQAEDIEEFAESEETEHVGKFEPFWKACSDVLDKHGLDAPDERRHGDITFKSAAISIRDLHELTIAEMKKTIREQDIVSPSLEWLRLQFCPRHMNRSTSHRYRRRFNMKFLLQTRILRKEHPDHHYGAKQKQFFLQKVSLPGVKEYCLVVFMDDKSTIPIGDHNAAASAVPRQRHVMAHGNRELTAT